MIQFEGASDFLQGHEIRHRWGLLAAAKRLRLTIGNEHSRGVSLARVALLFLNDNLISNDYCRPLLDEQ
jgi:hypothetical protein